MTVSPRKRRRLLRSPRDLSAEVISKSTQPKLPDHSVRAIGRLVAADGRELPICLDQRSTIGRHHASDHAIVDDVFVSTTHGVLTAFVTSAEDSLCILEDQSLNGTYVNGEHVHRRSVVLLEGDVIAIGLATFTFRQLAPTSQRFSALSVGGQQHLGDFIILPQSLGVGSFAVIHLAVDLRKHRQVACKVLQKRPSTKACRARIRREVDVMSALEHPNIVQLYDAIEVDGQLHLFLQLVTGGDLFQYLERRQRLNGSEAKWVAYQLALALRYMHDEVLVAHRDIKPENIICDSLSAYPRVLLSDFGTSRFDDGFSSTQCGTVSYLPPEVLRQGAEDSGYDARKLDCWAFGVLLYFLLTGEHPFERYGDDALSQDLAGALRSHDRLIRAVSAARPSYAIDPWPSLDYDAQTFVRSLLRPDPAKRLTAAEALDHSWIVKSCGVLEEGYAHRVLDQSPS